MLTGPAAEPVVACAKPIRTDRGVSGSAIAVLFMAQAAAATMSRMALP
jgi:hypothetical protein